MSAFLRSLKVFPDSIKIVKLLEILFAPVPFIFNYCYSETVTYRSLVHRNNIVAKSL